jgi:exonuclease III
MPNINIMSWNSNGETAAKAAFLQNLILNTPPAPDVILIQEARAAAGGAIFNMLGGLGGNYNMTAPQFAGIAGEGYILAVSNNVTLPTPFNVVDLAMDPGVIAAIADFLTPAARAAAKSEVKAMRDPAQASIGFAGRNVNVMTWHAPIGPSQVIQGINAAVNYDAYYYLQNSNYYLGTLRLPGNNNLSIVAGDLNVTRNDLSDKTHASGVELLLPDWVGVSSGLDHILAFRDKGSVKQIKFQNDVAYDTNGLSDHDVQVVTVQWP